MSTQSDSCSAVVVDLALTLSRGSVLLISALAGVLCIYLGWRLYRDAVVSKTAGLVEYKGLRFRLVAAGPGVFLVAFGAWLLVHLIDRPLEMSDPVTHSSVPLDQSNVNHHPLGATEALILRVADSPTDAQAIPQCIVPTRIRRLYGGGAELSLTRQTVAEALRDSIEVLQLQSKSPSSDLPSGSPATDLRRERTLVTLKLMLNEASRK